MSFGLFVSHPFLPLKPSVFRFLKFYFLLAAQSTFESTYCLLCFVMLFPWLQFCLNLS